MQHIDARLAAIMLVLDDLVTGGVDNVTRRPSGDGNNAHAGVYWEAYIKMHIANIKEELVANAEKLAVAEPGTDETALAQPGDMIFGGDDNEVQPKQPRA